MKLYLQEAEWGTECTGEVRQATSSMTQCSTSPSDFNPVKSGFRFLRLAKRLRRFQVSEFKFQVLGFIGNRRVRWLKRGEKVGSIDRMMYLCKRKSNQSRCEYDGTRQIQTLWKPRTVCRGFPADDWCPREMAWTGSWARDQDYTMTLSADILNQRSP